MRFYHVNLFLRIETLFDKSDVLYSTDLRLDL